MTCVVSTLREAVLSYTNLQSCALQNLLVKPSSTVAEAYAAEMIHFKAVRVSMSTCSILCIHKCI